MALTGNEKRGTVIPGAITDADGRLSIAPGGGLPSALSGDRLKVESVGSVPTSGGAAIHRRISDGTTNAQSIKASAGQVYGIVASNLNAAARYLKLYNKASAPVVGTDTPVMTILIPPNSSGIVLPIAVGAEFTVGIASALTTGAGDADATAVAANDIIFHVLYK